MSELEEYDVPESVDPAGWSLRVTGAVDEPLTLTVDDLDSLPIEQFEDDFGCVEGWIAEGLTWRGVRVGAILDRAGPQPDTAYGLVRAMDGEYASAFELDRLREAVLAVELDDERLAVEHGGPARLVPVDDGRDCWESVKWVEHIEVTDSVPTAADTARSIALSRIE